MQEDQLKQEKGLKTWKLEIVCHEKCTWKEYNRDFISNIRILFNSFAGHFFQLLRDIEITLRC